MTTVHLDNCCFNRPFDDQLHPVVHLETQAKSIEQLGIKTKDAMHIACALDAGADYFITTDKKILNKTVQGITIINPMEFVRRHFNVS